MDRHPPDLHVAALVQLQRGIGAVGGLQPQATAVARQPFEGEGPVQHGHHDQARPGLIVVAVLDGAFTLKRLARHRGRLRLEAANRAYPPLELHQCGDVQIWGVAIHVIHPLCGRHG